MTNSPTMGMKQSKTPATTPGRDSGRMQVEHDTHCFQDHVAERPLVHRGQQSEEWLERFRRGDPLQRSDRLLGHKAVRDQAEEVCRRGGIADLAQRVDRRQLKPEVAVQLL